MGRHWAPGEDPNAEVELPPQVPGLGWAISPRTQFRILLGVTMTVVLGLALFGTVRGAGGTVLRAEKAMPAFLAPPPAEPAQYTLPKSSLEGAINDSVSTVSVRDIVNTATILEPVVTVDLRDSGDDGGISPGRHARAVDEPDTRSSRREYPVRPHPQPRPRVPRPHPGDAGGQQHHPVPRPPVHHPRPGHSAPPTVEPEESESDTDDSDSDGSVSASSSDEKASEDSSGGDNSDVSDVPSGDEGSSSGSSD